MFDDDVWRMERFVRRKWRILIKSAQLYDVAGFLSLLT
jgi:hypothetical protein